jgi:hypothetical protein
MRSNYDLATNAPGKVGDVVNTIIDMTDGADDPANYLLTLMIDQISNSTIKNALNSAKPFAAGYLNDQLLQFAPDFVDTAIQLGNDFGQMARNFGTNEQLDVTGTAGALTSTHTILGAHFKIDNVESDINFADHAIENVVVPGVEITMDASNRFGIAAHTVPLPYGKVLRLGVDEVLIPMLEPSASNLQELLAAKIDCSSVGPIVSDAVYDYIGFTPGSGVFTSACNAGLVIAANQIYAQIEGIDGSALVFGIAGAARAVDSNNDRKIDKILTGQWTGNLSYGGCPAPISSATFFGESM